jgi:squalene-hopene/tetraprenyl-beta-curcumene cyclase
MRTDKNFLTAFTAIGLCLATSLAAAAAEPAAGDTAATIQQALPYLENEGVAWMEKRGCVSCHQVPFMLWSLSAAKQAGFDVDPVKLARWRNWSTDVVNFVKPAQKQDLDRDQTMAGNIDTMSALLLAVDDDAKSDWRVSFAAGLANNQKDKGSWKPCGQLPAQKRPTEETAGVTTAWTLLALTSQGFTEFDAEAALREVDAVDAAKSTEWWSVRLLLADRLGEDRLPALRQALLGRQNDDGGWGWISGEASDALATGMAIYALSVTSGDDAGDVRAALAKATTLLLTTQQQDGSWAVPGTKKNTRQKNTPTASYWGTAWAVIGLLELAADRS